MKAARLRGPQDLRIEEVAVPEIGPDEMLVRVRAAHLCGTDIRMYRHGTRAATIEAPLIPGHEISGTIERLGSSVSGYREGMRVAVAPNMGCGKCDVCAGGNTQLCPRSRALGVTLDGAFAELMKVPAEAVIQGNVSPIPDGVSFAAAALEAIALHEPSEIRMRIRAQIGHDKELAAALAEPLSCVYNSFERCGARPGDTVLVIGGGPIGLMHARVSFMAGAAQVLLSDVSAERLALCRGKEPALRTLAGDGLAERVAELTGGRGVDVCITACSAPSAQQMAFELAGLNGRVIFFGGLPAGSENVALNTNHIHYKQLTVTGTTRQSLAQYRRVLGLIGAGLVAVDDLVTHTYALEDIAQGYRNVAAAAGLKHGVILQ